MADLIPLIILALLLAEIILQLSWLKVYFRNGIPVYRKRKPFFGSFNEPFDTKYLEEQFKSSLSCTIFFKRFDGFECGFREKLWELRLLNYVPVMRGLLKGDERDKSFYVIGYLNWYAFFIIAYVVTLTAFGAGATYVPLLVLVVLMYGIQVYRFNKIAEVAFEWLKKNR